MNRNLIFYSCAGMVISTLFVIYLVLRIPAGAVGDSAYKADVMQQLDNEQDIVVLKRFCRLKLSFLFSSHAICMVTLFCALVVSVINAIFFALCFFSLRKASRSSPS